ncbi:PREDICTED: syntaxin-7 [Trachymyrmex cornetzi]|uniref:Syntaxin-12 n=1 Tax=Trachymyrmex cornetzi TaxID=471704 RepID=A0A151J1H6_9HYME|nr:PREDICTED: syntaxin-7 [Trachymyrmex cornetzi]KYN15746.1 Syntaxin-12 [Trachymyrmex cornetzi]
MDAGFSSYHNGGPAREQDFGRLSQSIGTSILKISQNVSSMQKMVNQLGSSTDSQELRNQLHQIQHYTQQLAKDTSVHLRDLAILANNSGSTSPGEQRQRKMQRERLQDEFTTALNSFQAVQRLAASKEKEMIRKAKASAGIAPFGEKKQDTLIELQDSRTYGSDHAKQQQEQMQEQMNLRMLEEQEASIRQLESNISDINQIFKDLGALVYDQGEVIDSIEASVERTEVSVNEGASQVRQASMYQTKLRKKKCFLVVIAVVIVAILIGIIVWQSK